MNGPTTSADGGRTVRLSPVQDAFLAKLARVTDLVLAADQALIPADVLQAALDARALFAEGHL